MAVFLNKDHDYAVTQIISKPSERYPYTHRIQMPTDLSMKERIYDWLRGNQIPVTIAGDGLYLREEYVSFFLLRWR